MHNLIYFVRKHSQHQHIAGHECRLPPQAPSTFGMLKHVHQYIKLSELGMQGGAVLTHMMILLWLHQVD